MPDLMGELGHISITISFVAVLVAAVSYFFKSKTQLREAAAWERIARWAFFIHLTATLLAVFALFIIIYDHQFQFHYAWKHSSKALPFYYVISCFWEGQEGSFLVWILWNAIIGIVVLKSAKKYEPETMMVIATVQAFLLSMILGVVLSDWKIGSSPFSLLRDVLNDPMFAVDPDFVPKDGTGLNPLLQNIWMVIHPPFIFLGFGISLVPFAYCMAGLMKSDLTEWVPKARVWLSAAVGVLGLGIMMGAYWAYETLNFGGYWNWDPVENAILIPWLVMLGALHGLLIYQKKKKSLMFSTALVLSSFVLVVYATFLTRSGILGDSSVHSFTDLGLSGQLLIFLIVVLVVSIIAIVIRRRDFSYDSNATSKYGFDFWLMVGVSVLCLSAFQVLIPTSIPVFSAIVETLGIVSNMAPPTDPVTFYSKFQLWFAVAFGLLMGVAQLLYWDRPKNKNELEEVIAFPLITTLVLSSLVILLGNVRDWQYIVLVTSTVFGFVVCGRIIYKNFKLKQKMGGPFAHIGFAVIILGFVFSAGYSKLVSRNVSINAPESSLPIHSIQEHALLNRNVPKQFGAYRFTYLGARVRTEDGRFLLDHDDLVDTNYETHKVLKEDVYENDQVLNKGDTILIDIENTFYDIAVQKGDNQFLLRPRLQNNPSMGYVASPDIHSFWNKDIYVHVSNFPDPEKTKWSSPVQFLIRPENSFEYKGLKIKFKGATQINQMTGVDLKSNDLAISTNFVIEDGSNSYLCNSVYLIRDNQVRLYAGENSALGVKLITNKINPNTGEYTVSIASSQRDWITIKAKEMPFIGLVWIGTIIMIMGITISVLDKLRTPVELDLVMKVTYRNRIKSKSGFLSEEGMKRKA